MKIQPYQYNYQVCPYCKSKRLKKVAVVRLGVEDHREMTQANVTGYICENCNRYHVNRDVNFITDRAEMRRDIKQLQAYLDGD